MVVALPGTMASRLELIDISKQYPGVRANDRVCLRVEPGEIHAVLGENGAGKSTLMKIIYGVTRPDEGELRWNGEPVQVRSPEHARSLGIAMVFQHFSLFESLSVAENVWLGLNRRSSLASVTARIAEGALQYGLSIDASLPVHALSVGERQRVEILRALLTNPRLLILDEPTSVLTPQAVEKLFQTLRALSNTGCSILYISHKLDEIRALCKRCTVLRDGRVVGEVGVGSTTTNAELSRLMIGREPPQLTHAERAAGDVALELCELNLPKLSAFGTALAHVNLRVHEGEIVGVAGISGNGQKELFELLSGEANVPATGRAELFGLPMAKTLPQQRRALGMRCVPEERLGRATVPSLSLTHNTLLTRSEAVRASGFVDSNAVRRLARRVISAFSVKARPEHSAKSLSGGNLQKFIMGREIDAAPKVLVIEQPTWGVDVGAAAQIRSELLRLRDAGCALLVISEELSELFEIADYLVVMAGGRISPRIARRDATALQIGEWMSGLWPSAQGAQHAPA
jgi:simple sugar transport system ATP-binding protein